jgi:pimeloyl-ACP methyl ester carboxylesterase
MGSEPGGQIEVEGRRLTDHSGTPRERATRLISLLFPPQLATEIDRQFGELVAEAQAELPTRTLQAQEAAMESWHRTAQSGPAGQSLPALVVHGDLDAVIPAANATALATRWPGAQVEILSGCTHGLMAQEPRLLADLIRPFAVR